ncbi:MAG: OmpA family protein [Gammaproteobacteria bacterium]|nr:OmpA family protein [Gammaproteobacteria bacterium]
MKLRKWVHVILVGSAMITLAACSSHRKQDQSAIDAANASYSRHRGVAASGLGAESDFTDQARGGHQLSKRIYYFDYDSNVVHDADKPAIMANANYLVSHPRVKVMLEGHTDPRGSREYNIGLGERRANAVASILIAKGVNPAQIRVVSYGAEKLASPGHTEAAYRLDRRVVLVYLK